MNILLIDGKMRNYLYMGMLIITLVILLMGSVIGAEQDKVYRLNYQNYQKAVQLMSADKYPEAQQIFASLDPDSQSSWQVIFDQAVCAQKTGDLKGAADLMQKARTIRPALLMNQIYLERYGEILYESGNYERARLYFLESRKYPEYDDILQKADKYLADIAAILLKTR